MAGSGAPSLAVTAPDLRVAIVAASWHEVVMGGLLDGARRALAAAGVTDVVEVRVPGAFELPVACATLADRGERADRADGADGADGADDFDALVALGVVIRGGTPHFDYVCAGATQGITEVMVRTRTPIGFGVLTCDDEAQALARAGLPGSVEDKGYEAAMAAVATVLALRGIG